MVGLQVASLMEKLQAKEVAGTTTVTGPKSDPLPEEVPSFPAFQLNVKAEDRLSTGSGGSGMVDEDGRQLVDSGDSFFLNDDYPEGGALVDDVQSEEDDGGSSDGRSFSYYAFAAAPPQFQEGDTLDWWVWS
ncbi:zipper protein [Sarracenia purpurea var. burkii]